jgi:hypothetical protein
MAIRSTDPTTPAYAALVDKTVTDDITLEDETISFFFFFDVPGPYSTGKQQLISNFNFSRSDRTTSPPVPAPVIPLRHDCDSITFRWLVTDEIDLVVPIRYVAVSS